MSYVQYLGDNFKGPDLGLGLERYYAAGRLDLSGSQSNWDMQSKTTADSAGAEKIFFYSVYTYRTNGVTEIPSYTARVPQVGLRTVRGR